MKFSNLWENIFYSSSLDENFYINDLRSHKETQKFNTNFPITCFDFDIFEEKVIIGGYFGELISIDIWTGKALTNYNTN